MYRGFWQSKLVLGAVSAAAVVLAVWVWIRDQGRPVYIPVLACILLLIIGGMTARLVANLIAQAQTTKLLGLLHMELDPEAFLKGYAQVPKKIPAGTKDNMIARFYLCDGYASAGEYVKANEALGVLPEKMQSEKAICGVYYGNLARNYLGMDQMAEAKEALDQLEAVMQGTEGKLHANLEETLKLYRAKAAVLSGEIPQEAPLTEALKASQYQLRSLEILQVLALIAAAKGESKKAAKYCSRMQREGGKTTFAAWASKQNA